MQLKLIRLTERADDSRHIGERTISHASTKASRSPLVRSVTSPAEARNYALRGGAAPMVAPIERPPVTPSVSAPPAPPGVNLTSGLRPLIAALILVALIPSLILASVFWFGAVTPPAQQPAAPAPAAQANLSPVLTSPASIEASAGDEIGFPIALDGTDAVPARSVIAIAGLPQGSLFTDGRPYGEAEWNLRSDQIGDLRLVLPDGANGESILIIKLIAPDGTVLAGAETILKVTPAAIEQEAEPDAGDAALVAVEDELSGEARPAPMEAAMAPSGEAAVTPSGHATPEQSGDAAPAPSGDSVTPSGEPEHTGSIPTETDGANFVQPSDHVNLRDGPSSSSRILGVVAKGAKVEVTERKRGWLLVTNKATSEQGWIYSGYVEGATKSSLAKRASRAEPEQKSESSFWSNVGQWFSSD